MINLDCNSLDYSRFFVDFCMYVVQNQIGQAVKGVCIMRGRETESGLGDQSPEFGFFFLEVFELSCC